jgi:hypothetical protein
MSDKKKRHVLRTILLIIGGIFVALVLIVIFAPEPPKNTAPIPTVEEKPIEQVNTYNYNFVFSDSNGSIAAEALFEGKNLVIHNISGGNLTNLYIIIQTLKGAAYSDQYVKHDIETFPNDEVIKIDKWIRIGDGPNVENTDLPGEGYSIRFIQFDCDEGTFMAEDIKKQQTTSMPVVLPILEEWQKNNNRLDAYIMMQEYVKQNLKAPATAKFGRTIDSGVSVTQGENYTYTIISYVDAQNEFGAMLRNYFWGEIKQVGKDEWLPLSLEFRQ